MGFLDFLSGAGQIGDFHGVDINKNDFQIQNADQLFGQTQDQYNQQAALQPNINNKSTSFLNTLEASANGQGPSLSGAMLKQAQDRNLQQQLAMAAGQRGGNVAANQRELLRAQSSGDATAAQQGVTAGLQEQMQNRQLYSGELNNQRNSVNQMTQQYLQQGFNIRDAQEKALADYNHLNVQQALGLAQVNAGQQQALAKETDMGISNFGGLAGSAMGMMGGGAGAASPSTSGNTKAASAMYKGS